MAGQASAPQSGADAGTGMPSSSVGTGSGNTAVVGNPDHLPSMRRCTQAHTPKPRGLRRLTGREVTRTLQGIFRASDVPPGIEAFGGDGTVYGFDTIQSALNVYNGGVVALQVYGEAVGSYAAAHLAAISACTSMDAGCRSSFIAQFGKRMYRRPLAPEEVRELDALMATQPAFADGAKVVVSAMVQSPFFLYRTELGAPAGGQDSSYVLGPYEVASALSYLLTSTAPDAELVAAADNDALGDANARIAQAQRLMATDDGKDTLARFILQWLDVDTLDATARTEGSLTLSSGLKAALREEVRLAAQNLWASPNSTLRDALTAPTTYVNGELASFYGGSPGGGGAFAPVAQASLGRHPGVLGMGGVIAAASQTNVASPTLRGRMLRMRMLCGSIGSPPASVPPISAMAATDGTLRGTYNQHAANPACVTCHTLMDPLGFTMGQYDTIGRRRPGDMENGIPVDTSGSVNAVGDEDVPLAGLDDLIAYLSTSDVVGACFARHWAMYAYGAVSWPQDGCVHKDVAELARASGYNLRATVLGLIALPSFVARSADT